MRDPRSGHCSGTSKTCHSMAKIRDIFTVRRAVPRWCAWRWPKLSFMHTRGPYRVRKKIPIEKYFFIIPILFLQKKCFFKKWKFWIFSTTYFWNSCIFWIATVLGYIIVCRDSKIVALISVETLHFHFEMKNSKKCWKIPANLFFILNNVCWKLILLSQERLMLVRQIPVLLVL